MNTIDEVDMYILMKGVLEFPNSTICVHAVAANILSLLESKGFKFPDELARHVVRAEDDLSLPIINEKIKELRLS